MTFAPLGDAARTAVLSAAMQRAKSDMARHTAELTSGTAQDPARRLGPALADLALVDRVIARTQTAQGLANQIATRLAAQQSALESAHAHVLDMADTLLRPDLVATDDRLVPQAARVARSFDAVVGALSIQVGGQSLFAGAATDGPALAPSEQILDDLAALIPAGADKATIDTVVADWFGPAGGFEQRGYLGAAANAHPLRIDPETAIAPGPTAADMPVRQVLATLAKGALMERVTVTAQTRRLVLAEVGQQARADATPLRALIERVGVDQARVDQALVRAQAEQTGAHLARTALVGVDPYEAASALQDSISRLEQVFSVTARLSRLSLGEFL